jgi:pyruvate-formate lyase-activating enzyme
VTAVSHVVLELVEQAGATVIGASFRVPVTGEQDARAVSDWCARSGNQLVSIHDGVATIRRGQPTTDLPALPVPRLWIYSNFDCNLACDYCCARSSPKAARRAVGLANITRLAEEAAGAGIHEIYLTGGEPFLLLDLDEIVNACTAQVPTTVLTNGMLFHGRRRDMLRRLPRDRFTLQISVDSATPGQHDRHRGAGSWQKAMDGARLAIAEGFHVRVAATVPPTEHSDLPGFHNMLDQLGIAEPDRVVRPVAQRGFADEGVALTVETLVPETTITANGVYWHPVGADHPDQLVTTQPFPLVEAVEEIRRRFGAYRQALGDAADRFPCA